LSVAEEGGDDDVEFFWVESFVWPGEPEVVGYCWIGTSVGVG
jgi:hypothetical protein